jgi:hypothetical protein
MKTQLIHGVVGCGILVIMSLTATGCRKDGPVPPDSAKDEAKVDGDVDTDKKSAIEAKLTAADELDGKADLVVSKCASCALGMDGSDEHALVVSGFTLHFCTEDCKTTFEKDATSAILALEIPEG